jgi:hypothetical protein
MSGFRKPGQNNTPKSVEDWAAQADTPATGRDRPWLDADPSRIQQVLIRMPAPLHAKLAWLKAKRPGGPSIQQQSLQAIEAYADQMIAQMDERARRDSN